MKTRIGILTGGGDCPGLNAVIRSVVIAAAQRGWATVGILGGFDGLLQPVHARELLPEDMDGLLYLGGTILGTSNRGRFTAKVGHGAVRQIDPAILAEAKAGFDQLELRALVVVGGDGSLTIGLQCQEAGIPVVGVPKTIDNDIGGTVVTFGFDTAVSFATDALDRLRSTAQSHQRVMVCEMMGRYAGWIALHSGISGGADVILLPEIPYDIVTTAGGAEATGGWFREARLGGIATQVAEQIQELTGKETRVCVLGHLQRGGVPTTFDRLICTRFGVSVVRLIAEERYGRMVSLQPPDTTDVAIADAIGKLRTVPLDGDLVRTARALGICLGDR